MTSDDQAWVKRAVNLRAMRLLMFGGSWHRHVGPRRWLRKAVLHMGAEWLSLHRRAWLLGLMRR